MRDLTVHGYDTDLITARCPSCNAEWHYGEDAPFDHGVPLSELLRLQAEHGGCSSED
jgi:hypothetical protein